MDNLWYWLFPQSSRWLLYARTDYQLPENKELANPTNWQAKRYPRWSQAKAQETGDHFGIRFDREMRLEEITFTSREYRYPIEAIIRTRRSESGEWDDGPTVKWVEGETTYIFKSPREVRELEVVITDPQEEKKGRLGYSPAWSIYRITIKRKTRNVFRKTIRLGA